MSLEEQDLTQDVADVVALENTPDTPVTEDVPVETKAEDNLPNIFEMEDPEATAKGHKPLKQWIADGRDPAEWKGPKAYLKDGSLFEHIQSQNKRIKDLEVVVKTNFEQMSKIAEVTRQKTINELTARQRSAAEIGDVQTVEEVTNKLIELNKENVPSTVDPDAEKARALQEIQEAQNEFATRNPWYNSTELKHIEMADYARAFSAKVASLHPHLSVKENLALVEKAVKQKFTTEFTPAAPKHTVVEGSSQIGGESSDSHFFQKLPREYQMSLREMRKVMQDKAPSAKDYFNELKSFGVI